MISGEIRVTVVIPVFNSETFLCQCLDSVLQQTLQEIEVICIDDCSSDRSAEILAEYQKKDRRISVMHNGENLGAGRCRNLGLERAEGEYLLFLDSDDWLFPGCLGKVWEKARRHKADVLRCRAADYDNETGKSVQSVHNGLKRVPPFLFNRVTDCRHSCGVFAKVCAAPWGGLVRRGFLLKHGIRFNDLICVNDRSFFWETMLKAERVVFARDLILHYRTHVTHSLVGGRLRNFYCHFESYRMVSGLCGDLPPNVQRCVLNAELLDMAHWVEQSVGTEYAGEIQNMLEKFFSAMDYSPWAGRVEGTKWYRRMKRAPITTSSRP